MTLESSEKMLQIGLRLVVGISITCIILAFLISAWFLVGVIAIWGLWTLIAGQISDWRTGVFESVFDNAFQDFNGTIPRFKISHLYGYPHFQLTYHSEEDLEMAAREGQSDAFKSEIQSLCDFIGAPSRPFDVNYAVYETYRDFRPRVTRTQSNEN